MLSKMSGHCKWTGNPVLHHAKVFCTRAMVIGLFLLTPTSRQRQYAAKVQMDHARYKIDALSQLNNLVTKSINPMWKSVKIKHAVYLPGRSNPNTIPQVRADGHSIPALLEAILQLLPLDTYVYAPVCYYVFNFKFFVCLVRLMMSSCQVMLMDLVNKDKNSGMPAPPVWETYQSLLDASEEKKVSSRSQYWLHSDRLKTITTL